MINFVDNPTTLFRVCRHFRAWLGLMEIALLSRVLLAANVSLAQEPSIAKTLYLLPEAGVGIGFNPNSDKTGWGYHGGVSVLRKLGHQYYGLHLSYLTLYPNTTIGQAYVSTGIVLMTEVTPRFQATIGTVGYIGVSDQALNNPFGLTTRLYYQFLSQWPIHVGLRSDVFFSKHNLTTYNALSISVTL